MMDCHDSPASCGACHYLFGVKNGDTRDRFFDGLQNGQELSKKEEACKKRKLLCQCRWG